MSSTADIFDLVQVTFDDVYEEDAQKRKDERMSICMKALYIKELSSGGRKISYWRCKDPRCEKCQSHKGDRYKERMLSVIDNDQTLYYVYLFKDSATKLCKRLRKDNYLRLPQNNDLDIIFYVSDKNAKADIFDRDAVEDFDWTSAVNQRCSRTISGNLGKEIEESEPRSLGYASIYVEDIVAGPVKDALQALAKTSSSVIAWQDPDDLDENVRFRQHYRAELLKQLKLHGCKIYLTLERKTEISSLVVNFFELDKSEL